VSFLHAGEVVDRYVVEALLGQGGMAAVYQVRHLTLDTVQAMKVLTLPSRQVRERMVREGRVQSALDHPNILSVHDVV
jgi:serine/threonine protein kinase